MKRLKLKVLAQINVLLSAVLSLFGCAEIHEDMYGVPYVTYQYSGEVTNEQKQPLEDIQVTIKAPKYGNARMNYEPVVTGKDGRFDGSMRYDNSQVDTLNVVFTDTTQVYQADSTQVVVKWQKSEKDWCMGECEFEVHMQLKKNTEKKE